jgi:hypothetical protein
VGILEHDTKQDRAEERILVQADMKLAAAKKAMREQLGRRFEELPEDSRERLARMLVNGNHVALRSAINRILGRHHKTHHGFGIRSNIHAQHRQMAKPKKYLPHIGKKQIAKRAPFVFPADAEIPEGVMIAPFV